MHIFPIPLLSCHVSESQIDSQVIQVGRDDISVSIGPYCYGVTVCFMSRQFCLCALWLMCCCCISLLTMYSLWSLCPLNDIIMHHHFRVITVHATEEGGLRTLLRIDFSLLFCFTQPKLVILNNEVLSHAI